MKQLIKMRNSIMGGHIPQAIASAAITAGNLTHGGTTVTTYKLGKNFYRTDITLAETTQIVTNAQLSFGIALCTFPQAKIHIEKAYLDIDHVASDTSTVTPIVGLGTTIATGATNALSGTAGFEDVYTGANATQTNGVTAVNTERVISGELDIKDGTTTAKTLYLNLAGAWAAARTFTFSGTVTLWWYAI
jgi:hypothetical protein